MKEKENNKYEWPNGIAFSRSENDKLPAMSMLGEIGGEGARGRYLAREPATRVESY